MMDEVVQSESSDPLTSGMLAAIGIQHGRPWFAMFRLYGPLEPWFDGI